MMTTFVDIQGEKLAVELYEPKLRIADVVLVHGWTGSKEDFNLIGPLLADAGYRVLTFDNRGQHESAHSKREDAYQIHSLARDVIDIAQHYGFEKPHLLGHSMGGLVAQRATLDAPNYWSSLTLFCTGPHFSLKKTELETLIHLLKTMTMADLWSAYKEEEDKLSPRFELFKKRWHASDPKSLSDTSRLLLDTQSVILELLATKIPAHVIYGENDDAWPLEMQDQMAKDLSAPRTIIKDAGHCPNEDQPEETVKVLTNFWSSL
jgi:pimeloyl-ACP methyl ester carboxylesterase